MSSCDSRLFSKAWAPLWVASLQVVTEALWLNTFTRVICCKMLPAFNRDVTGAQRVLEAVFVALCLFWKTAVLHSRHVASPSELGLHDQDLNTWHTGTAKYLLVGDSVLPGNAQEHAEVAEVELV